LGGGETGNGAYDIGGTGELSATNMNIGQSGTGTLNQNGGAVTAENISLGSNSTGISQHGIASEAGLGSRIPELV
jgi:hypothetical protein